MKALSIQVKGTVQGVFYRASTRSKANELGLKGWCRNELDGSVLIHAEGEAQALEIMVAWCQQGPRHARVRSVDWVEVEIEGYEGFEIRRSSRL